jgi:hypothetical protein
MARELAEAQRMFLEEHGHHALVANDLRELDQISKNTPLACAILGEDIGDGMKQAIATLLEENLAAIPILEEYSSSPVLPNADHILAGQPADLLAVVDDLLLPHGRRHIEHLQRKARVLRERVRKARETAKYILRQSRQRRAHSKKSRNNKINQEPGG